MPQKIAEKVGQVQEATRTLISNKQLMVMLLALSFGMFVTSTLRMYLIYNLVLDESIGVGTAVVLATMVHVSVLVGFTPGGFGIREGLVGLGSRLLSLPAAVGVIATVIERAVVIVGIAIVFIGGKSVKLISGKG